MMNAVGYRNDDGDLVEYDDAPEEIQNLLNEYQNIQYYRMEREYSKKKWRSVCGGGIFHVLPFHRVYDAQIYWYRE